MRFAEGEAARVDSGPDVHLFIFNFEFGLIDCDRLASVAVGLEQVFETMITVVNSDVTDINERFDSAERQPGVIHQPVYEDWPLFNSERQPVWYV